MKRTDPTHWRGYFVTGMVTGSFLGFIAFVLLLLFAGAGEASPGFVIFLILVFFSFLLGGALVGLFAVAVARWIVWLLVRFKILSEELPPYVY